MAHLQIFTNIKAKPIWQTESAPETATPTFCPVLGHLLTVDKPLIL